MINDQSRKQPIELNINQIIMLQNLFRKQQNNVNCENFQAI